MNFFKNYFGNITNVISFLIISYFILDTIRNWKGSPEIRIIKATLEKLTNTICDKL